MSILDKKLEFMDATSIAAAAATTVGSDNILDLGVAYDAWDQSLGGSPGEAGRLYFNARIATTLTAPAVQSTGWTALESPTIYLMSYTAAKYYLNLGTTLISQQFALTNATSVAGKAICRAKVPAGVTDRYLYVIVKTGASAISTGAVDAWLSLDSESELPTT